MTKERGSYEKTNEMGGSIIDMQSYDTVYASSGRSEYSGSI